MSDQPPAYAAKCYRLATDEEYERHVNVEVIPDALWLVEEEFMEDGLDAYSMMLIVPDTDHVAIQAGPDPRLGYSM